MILSRRIETYEIGVFDDAVLVRVRHFFVVNIIKP